MSCRWYSAVPLAFIGEVSQNSPSELIGPSFLTVFGGFDAMVTLSTVLTTHQLQQYGSTSHGARSDVKNRSNSVDSVDSDLSYDGIQILSVIAIYLYLFIVTGLLPRPRRALMTHEVYHPRR